VKLTLTETPLWPWVEEMVIWPVTVEPVPLSTGGGVSGCVICCGGLIVWVILTYSWC